MVAYYMYSNRISLSGLYYTGLTQFGLRMQAESVGHGIAAARPARMPRMPIPCTHSALDHRPRGRLSQRGGFLIDDRGMFLVCSGQPEIPYDVEC